MNEVIKNMLDRRSVRNYTGEKLSKEILDKLLEVAVWSPNAGNRQRTRIVVSQDNALNTRLGKAQNVVYASVSRQTYHYCPLVKTSSIWPQPLRRSTSGRAWSIVSVKSAAC